MLDDGMLSLLLALRDDALRQVSLPPIHHDTAPQVTSTRPDDGMLSLLLAVRDEVLRQVSLRLPPSAR